MNGPDFLSQTLSGQGGALANGVANPAESQPYTDEYRVQFERELMPNFAMRLTGAHSRALNQYRLANLRRPYEAYNIPITNRDPGPDGNLNTADDPGTTITYFEYPPCAVRISLPGGHDRQRRQGQSEVLESLAATCFGTGC